MRTFLDTSVLIATFYVDHERHNPSFELFLRQKKQTSFTAAHCLAEVYSVITGMPGKNRASPDEALLFLSDVRDRVTLVALDEQDYIDVVEETAPAGICGGTVYDALLARCALKVRADAIYTWNVKHFVRVGGELASRMKTP